MKISLHQPQCLHEKGQRENNEDNIFPAKGSDPQDGPYQLYLVCDGVGGLAQGEVASQLTCDVISGYLLGKTKILEFDIDHAILLAEQEIDRYIQANIDALGMATTLTLLSTHDQGITVAHVGDSRIYHIRGDVLLYKTFDHSFTNELVAKKIINESEASNHPKRNIVTKAIKGGGEHQSPDFMHFRDILPGDYFFLCTDGIIESITDDDLVDILNNSNLNNLEKIETIRNKCAKYSKDNHSAYLLQIKSVEKERGASFLKTLRGDNQILIYGTIAALAVIFLSAILANFNFGGEVELEKNVEPEQEKAIQMLNDVKKDIDNLELGDTVSSRREDSLLMDHSFLPGNGSFTDDSLQNEIESRFMDLLDQTILETKSLDAR